MQLNQLRLKPIKKVPKSKNDSSIVYPLPLQNTVESLINAAIPPPQIPVGYTIPIFLNSLAYWQIPSISPKLPVNPLEVKVTDDSKTQAACLIQNAYRKYKIRSRKEPVLPKILTCESFPGNSKSLEAQAIELMDNVVCSLIKETFDEVIHESIDNFMISEMATDSFDLLMDDILYDEDIIFELIFDIIVEMEYDKCVNETISSLTKELILEICDSMDCRVFMRYPSKPKSRILDKQLDLILNELIFEELVSSINKDYSISNKEVDSLLDSLIFEHFVSLTVQSTEK
ncbi:hypothetical protein BC833DRAFT_617869 [Globomyces pollinis-pini]|nr:hypothetical protein BC833DRAFT_617869 [Globomyces pollinis-pini]